MASMIHRLQRIVQEVNRAPDIHRALVSITDSLILDLNADACTIFLADQDDPDTLVLQACSGLNPDIIGNVRRGIGQGVIGTIAERAEARPEGSYTTRLMDDTNLRLQKLGEESAELVTAPATGDRERAAEEAADLIYHVLAALRAEGVGLEDVEAVLEVRAGG